MRLSELMNYMIIKNMAEKLGIINRMHLLGYQKNVCDLYVVADVFVLPSL